MRLADMRAAAMWPNGIMIMRSEPVKRRVITGNGLQLLPNNFLVPLFIDLPGEFKRTLAARLGQCTRFPCHVQFIPKLNSIPHLL